MIFLTLDIKFDVNQGGIEYGWKIVFSHEITFITAFITAFAPISFAIFYILSYQIIL